MSNSQVQTKQEGRRKFLEPLSLRLAAKLRSNVVAVTSTTTQQPQPPPPDDGPGGGGGGEDRPPPPPPLPGSGGEPVRVSYELQLKVQAQLTAMSDEEKMALGHSATDLIVDCEFAGTTCESSCVLHERLSPRAVYSSPFAIKNFNSLQQFVNVNSRFI